MEFYYVFAVEGLVERAGGVLEDSEEIVVWFRPLSRLELEKKVA